MTRTAPRVKLFGGFHNDPGSRRQFLRELSREAVHAAPRFVGVEWNPVLFAKYDGCRKLISDGLRGRWRFLGDGECDELSKAFAWEADAYRDVFRWVERVWLDDQPGREGDSGVAHNLADGLLADLWAAGEAEGTPAPRSKEELIDQVRLRQKRRKDRDAGPPIVGERDLWWLGKIRERTGALHEGDWIAIVVGWAHADPMGPSDNLYNRLISAGNLDVESIYLGLPPGH